MLVLAKTAVPEEVVPLPMVVPETPFVKVTVSPLGGAGVIVAVRVTLSPTFTVPCETESVVVVVVELF